MQSFFWHVLSDPRVYERLVRELSDAVRVGTIPAQGNLTWNQSQSLAYFQACLKEAMRVRPAVGLNITRLVPPEGAELDGHFFPGGTTVACNGWVLHRNREVFGEDADEYRPERWLGDEEQVKRMERYMFQVSLVSFCVLLARIIFLPLAIVSIVRSYLHAGYLVSC
jgi:cytochrome P450